MEDREKLFHLQLTVQKLQEEVSLYRNGTNGQELLELLSERDIELEKMKLTMAEKTEGLKSLAKKCKEVLGRCDLIEKQRNELQLKLNEADENINSRDELIAQLKEFQNSWSRQKEEHEASIEFLQNELTIRDDNVDKLQLRCATLGSKIEIL